MTFPGLRNRHRATPQPVAAPPATHRQTQQQPPARPVSRQPQTSTTRTIVAPTAPTSAITAAPQIDDFARQTSHLIPAEVRMIAGCHTEQTSADVQNVLNTSNLPNPAGKAGGACTSALLDVLYKHQPKQQDAALQPSSNDRLTFQQLLLELRSKLASQGHDQIPQLTSSRPLDVEATPFDLGGHNGTKRACLIGINYRGQDGQLRGCHNDVYNMQQYLVEVQGFQPHNILLLVDDGKHHAPTRGSIVQALRQLVAQSVNGDAVFVAYSGHGGLLMPQSNWFKRGQKDYDETLYPLDHQVSGQIRDFSLYRNFVQPMPAGVVVTAVMDCCHSGSVLDLPYSFQPTSGGMIRMRRNMDNLANLGMLYLLMGGMFPPGAGFEGLTDHIQSVTGGDIADYQGLGLDEDAGMDGVDNGATDYAFNDDYAADADRGFETDHVYGDANVDAPGYAIPDDSGMEGGMMGGDWTPTGMDDFDAGDGGDIDCGCVADVLANLLSDD